MICDNDFDFRDSHDNFQYTTANNDPHLKTLDS